MLTSKDVKFNLDWLQGVLPITHRETLHDFLNSYAEISRSRWVECKGLYNYAYGYSFSEVPGFMFCFNQRSLWQIHGTDDLKFADDDFRDENNDGDIPSQGECNNPYVFVRVSGQAISYLQEKGIIHDFLKFLYVNKFRATRFDVNCDIFNKHNQIVPLILEAGSNFIAPQPGKPALRTQFLRRNNNSIRKWEVYDDVQNIITHNVSLGNHGTETGMFRCYNKRVEVFDKNRLSEAMKMWEHHGSPEYWYRLEYELHKKSAQAIFDAYCENEIYNNIAAFWCCFCLFFDIVSYTGAKNTSDLHCCKVWIDFSDFLCLQNNNFAQLKIRNEKVTNDCFVDTADVHIERLLGPAFNDCAAFEWYMQVPEFQERFRRRCIEKEASEDKNYIQKIDVAQWYFVNHCS